MLTNITLVRAEMDKSILIEQRHCFAKQLPSLREVLFHTTSIATLKRRYWSLNKMIPCCMWHSHCLFLNENTCNLFQTITRSKYCLIYIGIIWIIWQCVIDLWNICWGHRWIKYSVLLVKNYASPSSRYATLLSKGSNDNDNDNDNEIFFIAMKLHNVHSIYKTTHM